MADIVFTGQTPSSILGQDEIPNNVDFVIYKGDFYEFSLELRDSEGKVIDISTDQPRAQIRENYDSATAIEIECSMDEDGRVYVYLSSAVSSTLNASKDYIWDLQTTNYKGDVKTWITGDVDVLNEVTR